MTYTGDVEMSCYGKPKDKPDAAPDLFEWLFVAKTGNIMRIPRPMKRGIFHSELEAMTDAIQHGVDFKGQPK